jgi:cytoskeleton protein RodZ
VQSGIGSTLREARKRREIGLHEVEAATKIRGRFLRAIEDEDWDALPGEAYARGFVRAYANYLGLDGTRLAAESPMRPSPPEPLPGRRRRARRAPAIVVCLALIAAAVAVGVLWSAGDDEGGRGGAGGNSASGLAPAGSPAAGGPASGALDVPAGGGGAMELSLTTTAELWVCLLDEEGEPLVDGVVLPAGAEEGPFRSGSFTVSFGNGEVEMRIDGRETDIPESASPLGYEVGPEGDLSQLSESARPTCT